MATTTPNTRRPPSHKFDHTETHRAEIEERTRNGETCKQIADALQARGITVSDKTVSRKRLDWGLRKRAQNGSKGNARPVMNVPRPNRRKPENQDGSMLRRKGRFSEAFKEEITLRTQQGEDAEVIAAALMAQGHVLKTPTSTVTRLQTLWKLIPYDEDRAKGRRKKKAPGAPRASRAPRATSQQQAAQVYLGPPLHYPSNCSFGPGQANGKVQHGGEQLTNTQVGAEPLDTQDSPSDAAPAWNDDDDDSESDSDSDSNPDENHSNLNLPNTGPQVDIVYNSDRWILDPNGNRMLASARTATRQGLDGMLSEMKLEIESSAEVLRLAKFVHEQSQKYHDLLAGFETTMVPGVALTSLSLYDEHIDQARSYIRKVCERMAKMVEKDIDLRYARCKECGRASL